jgi:hypothetical protein
MGAKRRMGMAVLVAALAGAAACDDGPVGSRPGETDPRRLDDRHAENTGSTKAEPRIQLELNATGAFRPGTPIVVTSRAVGVRASAGVEYDLVVLDEEPSENPQVEQRGRGVGQFRGSLARGGERQLTATVTFPRAGYYRVVALARGELAAGETRGPGDPAVIDHSSQTLYILVDEGGGRLTDGFDPTIGEDPDRALRYGQLGAFVPRFPEAAPAEARTSQSVTTMQTTVARTLVYYNENAPAANRPVPDALITYSCQSNTYPYSVISTPPPTRTASDGTFTVNCSTGRYTGRAELSNRYSNVTGRDGASLGITFSSSTGTTPVTVANRWAAHVFTLYNKYIPIAEQRFGDSRGIMNTYVAADATYDIHYHPSTDRIHHNNTRIFQEDGTFVVMHEYGHAFHYVGLEPPLNYWCSSTGEHYWDVQYTFSCAWVEGFATFFSVWVTGDALGTSYYSDNTVETQRWALDATFQPFYTRGDGAQIEGAVAAFLYDLADGTASPDGVTGDDDAATYTGTFLAALIQNCEPANGTSRLTSLDGVDLYIYCLEGDVTAYDEVALIRPDSYWYYMTSVTRYATPPTGFSKATVRALWKRNLYGV